jgi:hypothetical protein
MKEMKKMKLVNGLCILILMNMSCLLYGQQQTPIQHAFVLIDVSGSMKNDAINTEAKQLIKELLLGTFSSSAAKQRGWTIHENCDIIANPKQIVSDNSFLSIVPFGDKNRYEERKFITLKSLNNEFEQFYESAYRLDHHDKLTYLSLSQGYIGSLAKAQNIEKSYTIIYSDGLNDETGSIPYTDYENKILDSWDVAKNNNYNVLGILYRKSGIYTYKIYIGNLEVYNVEIRPEDKPNDPPPPPPTPKITIVTPQNSSVRDPAKAKTKKEASISWTGVIDASVSITKHNGTKYVQISSGSKKGEAKVLSKGGNLAKVIFYDSGKYKVTVSKGSVSDSAYFDVSSPFPGGLIIGLLALTAIIVGAVKILTRSRSVPIDDPDPWKPDKGNNDNKDNQWE